MQERSAMRSCGTEEMVGGCNEEVGEDNTQSKVWCVVVVRPRRKWKYVWTCGLDVGERGPLHAPRL